MKRKYRTTPTERRAAQDAYAMRAEIVRKRKRVEFSVLEEPEIACGFLGRAPFVKLSVWWRYKRRYGKAPS